MLCVFQTYPLTFTLMTRRTITAYVAALKYVNENLFELNGNGIIIDYENAMRAALKKVAPNLPIFGCWFHHVQALRRMMRSMSNLSTLIQTNADARFLFRKLQCLPLLPVDKIKEAFVWLLREMLDVHNFSAFAPYLEYYKSQWLQRVTPLHYSVFQKNIRTTAPAEAFNGKVNKTFRTHGNFFQFVESLQKEEAVKADQFSRDSFCVENCNQINVNSFTKSAQI